jgi:hypothetical protein
MLLAVQGASLMGIVTLRGGALLVVVALFGAAHGMFTLERATLVAERFGANEYGAVSGRIASWSLVGRAAAPFAVGVLAGATGSYAPAFLTLAAILAITAVTVGTAHRADRQNEQVLVAAQRVWVRRRGGRGGS